MCQKCFLCLFTHTLLFNYSSSIHYFVAVTVSNACNIVSFLLNYTSHIAHKHFLFFSSFRHISFSLYQSVFFFSYLFKCAIFFGFSIVISSVVKIRHSLFTPRFREINQRQRQLWHLRCLVSGFLNRIQLKTINFETSRSSRLSLRSVTINDLILELEMCTTQ